MRQFFVLAASCFFVAGNGQNGELLTSGWWHDYDGTLGGTPIQFSMLVSNGNKVTGSFCYREDEVKFHLTGHQSKGVLNLFQISNGDTLSRITLSETESKSGKLEGAWMTAADAPPMSVHLKPASSVAGLRQTPAESAKRYTGFSASDTEVEAFMKSIRAAILANDRDAVANAIIFPLKVVSKERTTKIKNRKRLMKRYDKIFTNEFKSALKNTCVCNLFTIHHRAILQPGLIWISEHSERGGAPRLGVITVGE